MLYVFVKRLSIYFHYITITMGSNVVIPMMEPEIIDHYQSYNTQKVAISLILAKYGEPKHQIPIGPVLYMFWDTMEIRMNTITNSILSIKNKVLDTSFDLATYRLSDGCSTN